MPKTNKVAMIDESVGIEQATLKRGQKVQALQTKHDIDSKLMTFFKIVVTPESPLMTSFVAEVNQACENLAQTLTDEYDVEVFDKLSGEGFFTEVIEGMKNYCSIALEKVQSDAKRTVLVDSGQVPAELWEVEAGSTVSVGLSADVKDMLGSMKK